MKESESILLLGLCICRDAVLTQVLKDALHSITCRAVILSHVTCDVTAYTETLTTLQLASRVHRMRRRRTKMGTSGVSPKYTANQENPEFEEIGRFLDQIFFNILLRSIIIKNIF